MESSALLTSGSDFGFPIGSPSYWKYTIKKIRQDMDSPQGMDSPQRIQYALLQFKQADGVCEVSKSASMRFFALLC